MLILNLLKQEWLKSFRSKGFYNNLAVTIVLGLLMLYFAVIFLIIGFKLNEILEEAHSSLNPVELFTGGMLYIMLGALMVRFIMQSLNTIDISVYQTLPIKRNTLVNFLLVKSIFSITNYISLLVVIPFALKSAAGYYHTGTAVSFIVCFVFVIWFDSLLASFLKRKFGVSLLKTLIFFALLGTIALCEYLHIFSLFEISKSVFGFIIHNRVGLLLPLSFVSIAFWLNKWFFAQNYYAEKFNKTNSEKRIRLSGSFSFLERFGSIGELMGLEIKLILRHKRTRNILILSGCFLLYGLMFYTNPVYADQNGMLFFNAMFITGILMLMFGQWIISWDSSHFDSIMTKNISTKSYIEANYYLMVSFCILSFVLTTPYFFFGSKIICMHVAATLYNIGVNAFLLLFFSTYNTKRIDLSKGTAMNYQGTTFKNFLIVLPILFIPMILVGVLSKISSVYTALGILSILGIAGIAAHRYLLTICVNQFNKRKYALGEGFRESA